MKFRYFAYGFLLLTLTVLTPRTTFADTHETLMQNIVVNCSSIKVRLQQVRVNDSLTRVNYGQAYESLIKNVMTPANTRLVANLYDASSLVTLTSDFNNNLIKFRTNYQSYKNGVDELINMDCINRPDEFYQKLESIRSKRGQLENDLVDMDEQVLNYQAEVARLVDAKQQ